MRLDRLLEHVEVHGQADLAELAALLLAEELAGAADLEIVRRQRKAGAELLERGQGLEPLGGIAVRRVRDGTIR